MIKHHCDMCGEVLQKQVRRMTIKNHCPLVKVRLELCEACHGRVMQMFPEVRKKIAQREKAISLGCI